MLGFDRLAILDLTEAASQPMRHDGDRLVARLQRRDLRLRRAPEPTPKRRGHRFRSSGDTEVLLAALVEWGTAALTRLRGMYAFAFFDGRTQRLVLARDPFGIKPLVYGRLGDAVVFASELRAIRAAGLADLTIDRDALAAYLTYGAGAPSRTRSRAELRMLPPGSVVEVDARGRGIGPAPRARSSTTSWRTPEAPASRTAAVEAVEAALAGAVASHLVSDVPLGVLLSRAASTRRWSRASRRASPASSRSS